MQNEEEKNESRLSFQLYDSLPIIRHLPLPFRKAFKNAEVMYNLTHKHLHITFNPVV